MREVVKISLRDIDETAGNRRPLNTDAVESLARSMKRLGLQTPISVAYSEENDHAGGMRPYNLVCGAHRYAAAKSLGWSEIECFEVYTEDFSEIDIRLIEISENLHRAELSAMERADQLAEWIRLTEEKSNFDPCGSKLKTEENPKGAGRSEGGVRAASRELGVPKSTAIRAAKIGSMEPDVRKAADDAGITSVTKMEKIASSPDPMAEIDRQKSHSRERIQRTLADRKAGVLNAVKGMRRDEILDLFNDVLEELGHKLDY